MRKTKTILVQGGGKNTKLREIKQKLMPREGKKYKTQPNKAEINAKRMEKLKLNLKKELLRVMMN